MLTVIKKNNYFFFLLNNQKLKTSLNNKIKVKDKIIANILKDKINLLIKNKEIQKSYFMKILYFHFDLKRQNINFFKKKIIENLNTDLLCYRANKDSEIAAIQKKKHDPLLNFVEKEYKLLFKVVNNIMPVNQDTYNISKLKNILNILNKHKFTAYYFMNTFSNSNIIALNFLANNIESDYLWECIVLEETYSLKKWGKDKEAYRRLQDKKKDFEEIVYFYLLFDKQGN